MRFQLPDVATAPFCPPQVQGTVVVAPRTPGWRKLFRFAGPGLLVAVGYMDPGNWATDIESGSRYGYDLLFVVLFCGFAAMLLQGLAMRLGLVARRDLAQMARERYSPAATRTLWILAEIAIVATDIAEVLGSALALKLLLGIPLWLGVLLTGFDTLVVLALQGRGFRQLEAIVLGLILTIAICFIVQLTIAGPSLVGVLHGTVPKIAIFSDSHALYLAVGILGATVMPHNLYLHSSIVQTRLPPPGSRATREALRFGTIDIVVALCLATLVNGAILTLSATTFHDNGYTGVADIEDAYSLLEPLTGAAAAALLFGIALLASGQSATFTGTLAGQVILEGFLNLEIPPWLRRVITRGLALIPALVGVLWLGDHAIGKLLVLTQVILSLQLPFAIFPLIRFTSDRAVMGEFASGLWMRALAWGLFGLIVIANLWLITSWF